jgi:tetratricopeptide (TPR) repeat protein
MDLLEQEELVRAVADDPKKAIEYLNEESSLDPEWPVPYASLVALGYLGFKEYDRALDTATQLICLVPTDFRGYFSAGLSHRGKGEYENAEFHFEIAILLCQYWSSAAGVYLSRGHNSWLGGDRSRALDDFCMAIMLEPESSDCWLCRGRVHLQLGAFQRALHDLNMAIELGCEDVDVWVGRGMAFNNLGREAEAYADLKKAWALGYEREENRPLREWFLAGFYYYRATALVGLRTVWKRVC